MTPALKREQRDNAWLYAEKTGHGGWFITLHAFDATGDKPNATFFWPDGEELAIPKKMVLLTVAQFTDLLARSRGINENTGRP